MARKVAHLDLELGAERRRRSESKRVVWRNGARSASAGDEYADEDDLDIASSSPCPDDGENGEDGDGASRSAAADAQEAGVLNLTPEESRERLRRRARFLRELAEARELRERVTPHRARRKQIHAALRRKTFRFFG
ncbi:hypothetical protein [Actinomadura harenae]|uniref:Uncharacterized protein n=1 Tax=Actinomadura harenae TaxID=2483351 RepID=A0A3M2MEJ3_9ACTN|nr:hypothetical protein [Actinomadura harenae]RMI47866.1 hypothetical protein EBO15_00820 [Actinomadura harenae]